ncbi:hypothetical protein FHT93_005417 [Rhizobium sp. BK379]|nr:hypothetical protein [Rhizobium sp. BK379]
MTRSPIGVDSVDLGGIAELNGLPNMPICFRS